MLKQTFVLLLLIPLSLYGQEINNISSNNKISQIAQDSSKVLLDRSPLYIGGETMMSSRIRKIIKYPKEAIVNGISGTVEISFTIDTNGKTSNYKVKNGIGYGCDEEALRVAKLIPENWLPGILNGKAIEAEYVLPIRFKIVDN